MVEIQYNPHKQKEKKGKQGNLESKTRIVEGNGNIVYHVGSLLPNQQENLLLVSGSRNAQGRGIYCAPKPDLRYSGSEQSKLKLPRTPIYCIPMYGEWRIGKSTIGYETSHTEGRCILLQDLKFFDSEKDGQQLRYYYSLHPVFFKEPTQFWGGDFAASIRTGKYTFETVIPDLMKENGRYEERVPEEITRENLRKAIQDGIIPPNPQLLSDINSSPLPDEISRQWIGIQHKSLTIAVE